MHILTSYCFCAAKLLRTAQSKRYIKLGVSLLENGNRDGFQNVTLLYKLYNGQKPKKKTVSVNFSHALFSLLDFLTYEDGGDR